MSDFIQGLEGDFFVQSSTAQNWEHLDCVSVADLPLPLGDLTTIYCPDPRRKGQVVAAGQLRGDAASGTTTIDRPLSTTVNWLFERRCAFTGLITWACDGQRGIPDNFELAALIFATEPTQVSIAAPVVRTRGDDARILTPAEVAYTGIYLLYHLGVNVVSVDNTAAANGVAFLPEQCESKCASLRGMCEEGYITLDGTLYDSEIKYTSTGTNWAQTAADPFAEGGDASSPVTFTLWNGHRAVVARISVSTHLGAEISYTEDQGATWTDINVNAIVGSHFGRHGLIEWGGNLYAAVSGGRIYRSNDMGDTWSLIENGVVTPEDLSAIIMYSNEVGYVVGDSNAFLYTVNGNDWYARTGPAAATNLLSVAVNHAGDVFVGAADGNAYRSDDGGQTWLQTDGITAGAWSTFGTGSIDYIGFDEATRQFGFLLYNTAAPIGTIYRSINAGRTWRAPTGQTGTWNAGLNAIHICDANHAFAVGEAFGGNTMIAQIEPR